MAIGRSFQEALHKATQSLEIKRNGLGADGKGYKDYETVIEKLTHASWDRVFVIYDAIQSAKSRKTDVLICDSAGRLHNKKNLMMEKKKKL